MKTEVKAGAGPAWGALRRVVPLGVVLMALGACAVPSKPLEELTRGYSRPLATPEDLARDRERCESQASYGVGSGTGMQAATRVDVESQNRNFHNCMIGYGWRRAADGAKRTP